MNRLHLAATHVRRALFAVLTLVLLAPGMLRAQLAWESPQLIRPGAPAGWSFIVIDYGLNPYTGVGGGIVWREDRAPSGLGIRASAAQGLGDKVNFAGGVDVSGPLLHSSVFPLELIWVSGIGGSYGEYFEAGIPIGVAGGRSVESKAVWFNPYTSARAVVEGRLGEAAPEGTFSLALAIDVGADLAFGPSRNFLVRMAFSLGDRHAAALGFTLGGSSLSSARAAPLRRH
ncbi:MAG: hypothetical protein ACREMA_00545 [Longimicrobiales bacterium]